VNRPAATLLRPKIFMDRLGESRIGALATTIADQTKIKTTDATGRQACWLTVTATATGRQQRTSTARERTLLQKSRKKGAFAGNAY